MRKLLIFLITGMLANNCFCQQDFSLKNILPPSPEASALIKSAMYPVGTYTGRPDITIPIYEIKTPHLSVPISLSYDATGIRVNDKSTWVGTKWSLDAGGMVSQMIIGEPDKLSTFPAFDAVPPRASEIVNNSTYFGYLKGLVEHENNSYPDSEPDKFFYSLPGGRNGSFVLDRDRNIMQIPKTSLKISIIGSLNGFNITDESGTSFVFSTLENTESYIYNRSGQFPNATANPGSSTYKNQKTAYYLSEIISNDGTDHIYFTYGLTTVSSNDESYTQTWGNKYPGPVEPQLSYMYYHEYLWNGVTRISYVPTLTNITFANGKVEFIGAGGRLDDMSAGKLDEIIVYNKNNSGGYTKLKSFKFSYGYYYSADTYSENSGFPHTSYDRYRLRLDTIKLKDATGNQISNYTFSYNSINPPPKTSCAQDWWGYYNGAIYNTTLVRPTNVFNGVSVVSIGGADRSSNENYMKAGVLEKIKYPTGGYTLFDFESHKYLKGYSWQVEGHPAYAQGNSSNNLVVETFTVPAVLDYQTGSGKLTITIAPYSSNNHPFVKIKNMTTNVEQTFTSPDATQWYVYDQFYEFHPGDTYQITASCYVNQPYAFASIYASFTRSVYDPHDEPFAGLRIKSIKNYAADNTLSYEENYRYGPNDNGYGVITDFGQNTYVYHRDQRVFHISGCGYPGGAYAVLLGGPLYDQCLTQGSPVVYPEVTKYYGTPSANAGKTVYYHCNDIFGTIKTSPFPMGHELANNQGFIVMNDAWKRGQLQKQLEYRKNPDGSNPLYTLVQEVENVYDTLTTDKTYGLFAQAKFDRILLLGWEQWCGVTKFFSDYAWGEYPINTGYVQLKQTIKKEYDPNGSNFVQTIINHTYDNTRKDIKIKTSTTNSSGQIIETETKFPFHKAQLLTAITSAESTAIDNMLTKNMLFPIEEISRKNNIQVGLKKTSYEYVNTNTIAPVNIKYQVKSNPIETRLQFTKYDANGNLVEQKKTGDVVTSYLWGYGGTVPVAQVVGADYTTVSGLISSSVLSDLNPSSSTLRTQLNAIRQYYANSNVQVTTYTYSPLTGVASVTDPNNKTNYYEYDAAGRLSLIRDQDNNIVKKYCYNYFGQPEDCSVYTSTNQSGNFYSQNCGSQTPIAYYVNIPAGMFTSTVSVAEANTQAQQYGQAQANLYGTCSAPLTTVFASNNTGNTYYLTFWNNSTGQNYSYTVTPWSTPAANIPIGTYTVTVSDNGSGSYALIDVMGYSTYGMFQYVSNLSIGSGYNNIYMTY